MIEDIDVSESSDNLNDFYDSDENVAPGVDKSLYKMTDEPLTQLDKLLLKGFYTSNRVELDNPSIFRGPTKGGTDVNISERDGLMTVS